MPHGSTSPPKSSVPYHPNPQTGSKLCHCCKVQFMPAPVKMCHCTVVEVQYCTVTKRTFTILYMIMILNTLLKSPTRGSLKRHGIQLAVQCNDDNCMKVTYCTVLHSGTKFFSNKINYCKVHGVRIKFKNTQFNQMEDVKSQDPVILLNGSKVSLKE